MRTVIASHELLPRGRKLESLSIEVGHVSICAGSGATRCVCPVCGHRSARAHSRYHRTVSDLPWHGISVTLKIRARRFFCDDLSCKRKIFCERLPEVAARARKTVRVEVASRDRSNIYREGLAKGAPGATHVADRWHLLHNLALTLEEYLLQKRPILRKAAAPGAAPEEKDDADFASGPIMPNRPRNHDRKIEEAARKRHERLIEQWRNIRRLYFAKADLRDICRRLGISARTVYRYKDLKEPPPRPAYKRRASVLDPYVPYLLKRWNEGCHNGKRLYREIRERGYANSEETCARFTTQLRRAEARGRPPSSVPRARGGSVAGLSPTAKNVAALFMRHQEKLDEEQSEYLG